MFESSQKLGPAALPPGPAVASPERRKSTPDWYNVKVDLNKVDWLDKPRKLGVPETRDLLERVVAQSEAAKAKPLPDEIGQGREGTTPAASCSAASSSQTPIPAPAKGPPATIPIGHVARQGTTQEQAQAQMLPQTKMKRSKSEGVVETEWLPRNEIEDMQEAGQVEQLGKAVFETKPCAKGDGYKRQHHVPAQPKKPPPELPKKSPPVCPVSSESQRLNFGSEDELWLGG